MQKKLEKLADMLYHQGLVNISLGTGYTESGRLYIRDLGNTGLYYKVFIKNGDICIIDRDQDRDELRKAYSIAKDVNHAYQFIMLDCVRELIKLEL